MAQYPNTVKVFTTKTDLQDIVYAADMNEAQAEIVAIQTTLGTSPQGASATVKDRIAAVETGKAASSHTHDAGAVISGVFPVARGGTGQSTLTAGSFLKGNGTNAVTLRTPAEVLSDIGASPTSHKHDADYAPLNTREQFQLFSREGNLTTLVGKARLYFPWSVTVINVRATVGTAPSGASIIVDVNKNGSTLYTTQSSRPTIAAGAFASGLQAPQTTALTTTDYMTVDVDQVGSTVPGADLSVIVTYRRT